MKARMVKKWNYRFAAKEQAIDHRHMELCPQQLGDEQRANITSPTCDYNVPIFDSCLFSHV